MFVALEIYETPTLTPADLLLELVELVPIVLLSVGFVMSRRACRSDSWCHASRPPCSELRPQGGR